MLMVDWLVDLNDMSTCLDLSNEKRSWNRVYCTCISPSLGSCYTSVLYTYYIKYSLIMQIICVQLFLFSHHKYMVSSNYFYLIIEFSAHSCMVSSNWRTSLVNYNSFK